MWPFFVLVLFPIAVVVIVSCWGSYSFHHLLLKDTELTAKQVLAWIAK